ncbi:amino acid ABC transporter permease [Micrococcus sp. M4NT]|uniref:amino acid ABC transporter permease n=1 Tax=Micrococcus sp. M4NT TaxID=2957501 RepID=UPI0029B82656|nr:amino acid ABC transporter permease [Micrococcus sp. M4NT]MDX2340712.1 amino acid ABC transporter permease [Micrococcus sp. M4NT]
MSTQTPVPATAAREASPTPGRARRRRTRSVAIQASVFVLALVALALAMDWQAIGENVLNFAAAAPLFPNVILVGLGNTLFYTATAFVVGLLGGILLALMRMSSFAPYRWLATAYIEFFRGVPALLVFLAFGYGVPFAFGITWPIPVVVMLALGMVAAAYIAETLRAGLQAVPKGQMEAARSLGMPHWRAMVTIVIPQAFRIVLPPLTNEVILLTKDSSLVYVLGLAAHEYELTKFGRDGISALDAGMTPILVAGLCYLVITVPLSMLARRFESRSARKGR